MLSSPTFRLAQIDEEGPEPTIVEELAVFDPSNAKINSDDEFASFGRESTKFSS